ncbi:MAG: hypothetical protein ACYSU7_12255 [Planctomycetota bacterium]|jgi:hypothetical protein
MDTATIRDKFTRMGARLKLGEFDPRRRGTIDIGRDRHGEFFEINADRDQEVQVIDVRPKDRHLLLMIRDEDQHKHKFVCGHDERHWFVAAVPESASAAGVAQALEALKPEAVQEAEEAAGLKGRDRKRRKNPARVRQGEWFFIPAPTLRVDERMVLRREPLRRGGGSPHWAEYAYRTGGETVFVNYLFPNGLTAQEHAQWRRENRRVIASVRWQLMLRDPDVYVKGTVKHRDHATIRLDGWHRVMMNTETMSRVAFLD